MKRDRGLVMLLGCALALGGCAASLPATSTRDFAGADSDATTSEEVVSTGHVAIPDFSGQWLLNAKASDDPQEKMKQAMQAMKRPMGGGHRMGGVNGGGKDRGMGGRQQKRAAAAAGGGLGEIPLHELLALVTPALTLDISHREPLLLIGTDSEGRQRIFTDFRGSSISSNGGPQQRVTVAGWEGRVLVVETTLNNGSRLVQNYQLDGPADRLVIDTAANLPERQPVTYRLVYERQ